MNLLYLRDVTGTRTLFVDLKQAGHKFCRDDPWNFSFRLSWPVTHDLYPTYEFRLASLARLFAAPFHQWGRGSVFFNICCLVWFGKAGGNRVLPL